MFTTILKIIQRTPKRNISALYIPGDKASETFSVLTPHIDFDQQLKNKSTIIENIKKRNLDLNLEDIISTWIFYKKFMTQRSALEETKMKIAQQIKSLDAKTQKDEIDRLINHGRLIKNDLKALRDSFYSVEENAIVKVLGLPNKLHSKAPGETTIIAEYDKKDRKTSSHHLEVGAKLDLIDFRSNDCYYLKNDAALFELTSTNFILNELLNQGFIQFSNPDFCRSVIAEGCGIDFNDPKQIFTLNEPDLYVNNINRLHLVGGSSPMSFFSYFTKHIVYETQLPIKLVTISRKYQPVNEKEPSLFNTTQSTCIDFFIATKDDDDCLNDEIDLIIKNITEIYKKLNYNFRLSFVEVPKLKKYESLHVSIEMYSSYLQKYVEVGYISVLDNYVSKRLLFNYGKGAEMSFPKVLCGTIFNVPKVLGCLLENDATLLRNYELDMYFSC